VTEDFLPIVLREVDADAPEIGLIYSGWLQSLRNNPFFGMVPEQMYFTHYRPQVGRILATSKILLACNPDEPDQIFGFVVYRFIGDIPHISYAYTKGTWRRQRVADRLVNHVLSEQPAGESGGMVSHMMPWLLAPSKNRGLIFNPFKDLELLNEKD